ncbi:MAG: hypothetical protein JXB32_15820 [Deltaproteobacteria bacterium]|nr:hypothetical protein [Deltaproteobacteria bacterium]
MMVEIAAFALIMFMFWLADRIRSNRRTVRPADPCPDPGPDPAPRHRSAPLVDVVPADPESPARRTAPIDVSPDPDPDPEPEVDPMPYDSDRCWGCSKRCTYRKFRVPEGGTADEVHRVYSSHKAACDGWNNDMSQNDASEGRPQVVTADDLPPSPIEIARAVGRAKRAAWFDFVSQCSEHEASRRRGEVPEVTVEPAAVAAEECPF